MTSFIQSTKTEIIDNTLVFIPHTIHLPSITTDNLIQQAASDIITLLTCTPSQFPSLLELGD